MGTQYWVRTSEVREFPLNNVEYTDYYVNSRLGFIKLLITKRKLILFTTKYYL